jgi:hypothetical protein
MLRDLDIQPALGESDPTGGPEILGIDEVRA